MNWATIVTFVSGGLFIKFVELVWTEIRRRSDDASSAKAFVDSHLGPLLKAADELVGKLRSSAERDFKDMVFANNDPRRFALAYLFARFWAQVEILKQQGLSVSLTRDSRGKRLLSFLDSLEAQGVRIVDRISQRAVGEITIDISSTQGAVRTYTSFLALVESDPQSARWIAPVEKTIADTDYHPARQKLLLYGAVLHAMIDDLDPEHHVTHDRPAYAHKLNRRSWKTLKYSVFGTYLKFVARPEKYFGPRRNAVQNGED